MATITAAIRSTSSLTVAPTQNTAPVFEFRCLYTRDVRKKKKTWHDGSLRFHSFNKRVMVYDDQKYFIGDLHCRESDTLNEGDELKLDKGVLVHVGEPVGHTETDLAPLLEKGRPQNVQTSSPPRAPLRSLPSATTLHSSVPYSQTRPRSLADVLGASQGPIGRAKLPSQSPFDRRQQQAPNLAHADRRTVKRRKLEHEKENQGPGLEPSAQQGSMIIGRGGHVIGALCNEQRESAGIEQASVLEISASQFRDSSCTLQASHTVVDRRNGRKTARVLESTNYKILDSPSSESVPRRSEPSPAARQLETAPKPARISMAPPASRTSADNTRSMPKCRTPVNNSQQGSDLVRHSRIEDNVIIAPRLSGRLKFAPSQPKRKLMYKALLESPTRLTSGKNHRGSGKAAVQPLSLTEKPFLPRPRRATERYQLSSSSDDESDMLKSRQGSRLSTPISENKDSVSPRRSSRISSPIFFSQSPFKSQEPFLQQSQDVGLSEILLINEAHSDVIVTPDKSHDGKGDVVPQHTPGHDRLEHPTSPPVLSHLAELDRRLCAPLASLSTKRSTSDPHIASKISPFRRTHSESDANSHAKTPSIPLDDALVHHNSEGTEIDLAQVQQATGQAAEKRSNSLSKLQISVPDALTSIGKVGHQTRHASIDVREDEEDRGPWTTTEAFDLFATWPAVIEKPVFGARRQS